MDGDRFDGITRKMADRTSRRRALQFLAGGVVGSLAGIFGRRMPVVAEPVVLGTENVACSSDADCEELAQNSFGQCATGRCFIQDGPLGAESFCVYYTRNAGEVCRAAAGPCDRPEVCDGSTPACPADAFAPTGTVCREALGPCQSPATCTGASSACPPNEFLPQSTVCRDAVDACDVSEYCTGSSPYCPGDALAPAGTVCREASGPCQAPGTCTGASSACPPNEFLTSGVVCRDAVDACDTPEYCTGSSPFCPADAFAPAGTPCGADGDVCNGEESCDGAGSCVAGTPLTCPEDGNPCTAAVCHPATGCAQEPVADGTPCNGTGGCTAGQCITCRKNEEVCNGLCRWKSSYNGDDRNCGACGHACPDNHVCKGGFCRPLK